MWRSVIRNLDFTFATALHTLGYASSAAGNYEGFAMKHDSLDLSLSALIVGEYEKDRSLVRDIFYTLKWRLFEARDRRGALHCLKSNPVHVVLAETDVRDWNWKKMLQDLRRMKPSPQLIVTSRLADNHLWAEALNVGAYDVLAQPLERDEVERVVASARRHFDFQPNRSGSPLQVSGAA
jgi:response regulator RpfG family c-di-GMP phosphodiesterase